MSDLSEQNAGRPRSKARDTRSRALTGRILVGFLGCLLADIGSTIACAAIAQIFSNCVLLTTPAFADGRHNHHDGSSAGQHQDDSQQQQSDHQSNDSGQQNDQSNQSQDSSQHQQRDGENDSNNGNGNSNGNGNDSGGGTDTSVNNQSEGSKGFSDGNGDHSGGDRGDGGDQNTAKSSQAGTGDKTKSKTSIDDSSKPPKTVEQWLKRLFKQEPGPTEAAGRDESKQHDAKQADGNRDGAKQHDAKQDGSKHASVVRPPIVLPEINAPEVLAVNATPLALERAKALGFTVARPTSLSRLELSVTPLLAPDGMDAATARNLLAQELPTSSFGINQKYRIYKTATGTKPDQLNAAAAVRNGGNSACDIDHCFGRNLIGWKPEFGRCAAGIRIGIIDTGVDFTHPAFSHKKFEMRYLGFTGVPSPDWHGTGVTALLAGDSLSGTPGLIPDAQFKIADIFHADADGEPASDTFSMLRALDWLEAKNVNIINMSLSGPQDDLVGQAIQKLSAKGILFVAAAGNDGPAAGPSYPAAYDSVIAVTAVGKDMQSYRYANRGAYIDIAAPGVSIWTALPGSKEGYHSGTSFATPYVTATLAAIYSRHAIKSKPEALNQMDFRDLGAPGRDPVYGEGLLVAPATCGASQIARSSRTASQSVGDANLGGPSEVERLPWSHATQQ